MADGAAKAVPAAVTPPPQAPAGLDAMTLARGEFARAVRTVAGQERDMAVVARLYQVAALVTQELAGADARQKVASAVPVGRLREG